jgi:hypothetical protein
VSERVGFSGAKAPGDRGVGCVAGGGAPGVGIVCAGGCCEEATDGEIRQAISTRLISLRVVARGARVDISGVMAYFPKFAPEAPRKKVDFFIGFAIVALSVSERFR